LQSGVRDKTSIQFCSALGAIFGVQKYAKELSKICEKRDLNLNFRHNLVKVNAAQKTATFDILNADGVSTGETQTMQVW
jgi:sulfide:quinone oxidoreductase